MKRYWFGSLLVANLVFLFVNMWKISYTYNPGPLVAIGALVAFANAATALPLFIKAYRHRKAIDATAVQ